MLDLVRVEVRVGTGVQRLTRGADARVVARDDNQRHSWRALPDASGAADAGAKGSSVTETDGWSTPGRHGPGAPAAGRDYSASATSLSRTASIGSTELMSSGEIASVARPFDSGLPASPHLMGRGWIA